MYFNVPVKVKAPYNLNLWIKLKSNSGRNSSKKASRRGSLERFLIPTISLPLRNQAIISCSLHRHSSQLSTPLSLPYDQPHNLTVRCSHHHRMEIVRLFPAGQEDVRKFHYYDYVDLVALWIRFWISPLEGEVMETIYTKLGFKGSYLGFW
ncbi:hypothetical protein Hdeb2414_s0017g00499951 [Helianthus debilis subsp. tardiflorus]